MPCEQCGGDERTGTLTLGGHAHHVCLRCLLRSFKSNIEDKALEAVVGLLGLEKL